MDCKICKETKGISQYEKDIQSAEHRHSMSILWRIILGQTIIICLLVGGIFYTVNNFNADIIGTTETVSVDGKDGVANYIGNDGSIVNNGEDSCDENGSKDTPGAQGREEPSNS
jgi:hypothetical protein